MSRALNEALPRCIARWVRARVRASRGRALNEAPPRLIVRETSRGLAAGGRWMKHPPEFCFAHETARVDAVPSVIFGLKGIAVGY